MDTTIVTILVIFLTISFLSGFFLIAYNIKKWWVLLFVLGVFLSGFFLGLLRGDLVMGLELGAVFAGMILSGGFMTRYWRNFFQKIDSRSRDDHDF